MLVARGSGEAEVPPLSSPVAADAGLAIVLALIEEIQDGESAERARGVLRAVGRRLARLAPMDGLEGLEACAAAMNRLWRSLGLGSVTFTLADDGVDVRHAGLPLLGGDQAWARAAPQILEGAYDEWFRSLGSGPRLRTRLVRAVDDRIELHHGL